MSEKKVFRTVAIATSVVCIILSIVLAGVLASFVPLIVSKDSSIFEANSLIQSITSQRDKLQTSLDGNCTLLDEAIDEITRLQQWLDGNITAYESQISDLIDQIDAGDTVWDNIVKTGKILVGTDPYWPPYQYLNDTGHLVGFEVELMEVIADELDLTVEWSYMTFDTIIPAVQSKDIDLGVSGFSVTSDRLEVMQFAMSHSISEGQIIMLNSTAMALGITEFGSLIELGDLGLICGTEVGTMQEDELLALETAGEIPSGTVKSYSSVAEALTALKTGIDDCVYAETPITSWWILEAEQNAEEPLVVIYRRSYWPVAFVAHKDSDILISKINGALAEIIATGRLDELRQKWKC